MDIFLFSNSSNMVYQPHVRSPPQSPSLRSNTYATPTTDDANSRSHDPVRTLYQNGDKSVHDEDIVEKSGLSPSSNSHTELTESSPLKVAASLIQSLDIAHTEMTSFAADAAADAESARRNARTAQEIVRRYQNQSYPTFKMDALEHSSSTTTVIPATATAASSSFKITPRPKRPELRFHDFSPIRHSKLNGFNERNDEEKEPENDSNQENKSTNNSDGLQHASQLSLKHSLLGQSGTTDKQPINVQKRGILNSPASFERIAQHHADDVLQLTLELEKVKQALKSEQRLHRDCQSALASSESKKVKLENINQKLVESHATEQNQSATQISHLKQELEHSKLRLQAAEEDAQLALDLAKDSAEQRDKIEDSLLQAKKEIELLMQQQGTKVQLTTTETPKRNVHFADTDAEIDLHSKTSITPVHSKQEASPVINSPRENGPPRSMIAAGRQILLRQNMSPQDAVIRLQVSPKRSSKRRQQLCQRLNEHLNKSSDEDDSIMLLSSSPSRTPHSPTPGNKELIPSGDVSNYSSMNGMSSKKKLDECHSAMKILQISGKRLSLDGYWWREQHSKTMSPHSNSIQIDILARQYCQNVEFKIDRQQKDINQLQSLCGYLEKKLVLDEEPSD